MKLSCQTKILNKILRFVEVNVHHNKRKGTRCSSDILRNPREENEGCSSNKSRKCYNVNLTVVGGKGSDLNITVRGKFHGLKITEEIEIFKMKPKANVTSVTLRKEFCTPKCCCSSKGP